MLSFLADVCLINIVYFIYNLRHGYLHYSFSYSITRVGAGEGMGMNPEDMDGLPPTEEELNRERPALRKIDQHMSPDCPCCNMTKRFTMAVLASIGT